VGACVGVSWVMGSWGNPIMSRSSGIRSQLCFWRMSKPRKALNIIALGERLMKLLEEEKFTGV